MLTTTKHKLIKFFIIIKLDIHFYTYSNNALKTSTHTSFDSIFMTNTILSDMYI